MVERTAGKLAVLLDRDGTINRDVGFTHRVEDLELLPGAAAGLVRMAALGYRLFIATNQSGIARGMFSEADMHAFNKALCDRLQQAGVTIDAVYFCPFHPTEGVGQYRHESPLRKPGDGMLRLAATQHGLDLAASFVVGDKNSDIAAGQAAGCRTVLVRTGAGGGDAQTLTAPPDFVAADLLEAANYIERTHVATTRSSRSQGEPASRPPDASSRRTQP